MAQGIRPNKQLALIAYNLLNIDKSQRQKTEYKPTERQKIEWASTYTKSNIR